MRRGPGASEGGGGAIHGLTTKTGIYLPEELKRGVEREGRRLGQSEAEVIRRAIAAAVARPRPRPGIFEGEPMAEVADASIVVLAARLETRTILTLDRRHFGVLRPLDGGRFKLLP